MLKLKQRYKVKIGLKFNFVSALSLCFLLAGTSSAMAGGFLSKGFSFCAEDDAAMGDLPCQPLRDAVGTMLLSRRTYDPISAVTYDRTSSRICESGARLPVNPRDVIPQSLSDAMKEMLSISPAPAMVNLPTRPIFLSRPLSPDSPIPPNSLTVPDSLILLDSPIVPSRSLVQSGPMVLITAKDSSGPILQFMRSINADPVSVK